MPRRTVQFGKIDQVFAGNGWHKVGCEHPERLRTGRGAVEIWVPVGASAAIALSDSIGSR